MAHSETPESGYESPGYYILLEDSSTQTTDRDFFILEHTRDATTQTTEEEFIFSETTRDASTQTPEDDLDFLEQPPVTSEASKESRKRKTSNELQVAQGSNACKLRRIETCIKGDELNSSFRKKSRRNPDAKKKISAPNRTQFKRSRLNSIDQAVSDSEESYCQNQEINVPGYSGQRKKEKKEENIARNKNISEKGKAPSEKSDTDVSKVTNVCSNEDMLVEQSSLRCQENDNYSKELVENNKNISPPKQPPVETERKQPHCIHCKKTISKHVGEEHDGKDIHRCCQCLFTSDNFNYLQMHVYNEHKRHFCNICNVKHLFIKSSASYLTCDICDLNFECKYQFGEHNISEHKDYFEKHCRICNKKFDEHLIESEWVRYECCVSECKYRYRNTSTFNEHLSKHSPLQLFKCEICGCHSKQLQGHKQSVHSFCKSCGKWFVNIYFLNEHHCEELMEEECD